MLTKKPRVAIIHDWLLTYRGGEKVLDAILSLYPDADIFTLFYRRGAAGPLVEKHRVHASFLNHLPGVERYYRYLLPLFPLAIERFDLRGFDLVISSSHCAAKGVIVPPNAVHVCYCHTPMRYAWDRYQDYFGDSVFEPFLYPFIHYLRGWDVTSAQRVDHFIANSHYIAGRIEKYYRREADVVYPFADSSDFEALAKPDRNYYLTAAAFAPYKRLDLAIAACEKLGRTLYVAGSGQDEVKLKSLGTKHTRFLGRVSSAELKNLYANCRALLFPGEEDFGIAPLEAMASGRPVVAYGRGGVTETVVEGETGVFFQEQSIEATAEAIERFEARENEILPERCRTRAAEFSRESFIKNFSAAVEKAISSNRPS